MLFALLGRVLTWLLPGGGARRRTVPAEEAGPVGPPPRARPRSPYAREAAADYRVDVSEEPLTRPYYRHYRQYHQYHQYHQYRAAPESMCAG
ncbi:MULTISPECIES: hypothetical protein [unclassified Streptomyces]|uniref:hypothetical protein n=1 Tax=unclassified Streptomyces TaxID=2593676 RepID=UPI0036E64463